MGVFSLSCHLWCIIVPAVLRAAADRGRIFCAGSVKDLHVASFAARATDQLSRRARCPLDDDLPSAAGPLAAFIASHVFLVPLHHLDVSP